MALRVPLSAASTGNLGMALALNTAANTAFAVGTNMLLAHTSAGMDEMIVEVCNIDTAPRQLVGSVYQGAITAPDDLFYQTIPAQSGWVRFLAGDILPAGAGLALGVPGSADASKLNVRGFANRIVGDARKMALSAAGAYNKSIKITGTTAGAANTLHTAVAGTTQIDEIYLNLTNTSTAPVLVTLCIGGTASACQMLLTIPGQCGWTPVLVGENLNNGLGVSAFAATANVINARGWANRVS